MNTGTIYRFFLLLAVLTVLPVAQADGGWQRQAVATPYVDRNGEVFYPSCSGAPVPTLVDGEIDPVPAPTEFSFFYRPGNPEKLVIAFDGGGACWDPWTCIFSALVGDPIYDLAVDETEASLDAVEGLAAADNPENPVADYTQVFIPYCTGDLHTGSSDTVYDYVGPGGPLAWTIHHRGYDNFAAVIDWLVGYYGDLGIAPRVVFVVGASAGGYGAAFNYPAIHDLLPFGTVKRVFSDSANGIINQDFYNRALTPGGVWGIWNNMPPALAGAFAAGPDSLPVALNQSLAWSYPRTRFGQYTRAFDVVQIFYLNVARNRNNPALWSDPLHIFFTGLEWTYRARISMVASALTTFNYRYYLASGLEHTTIADNSVYAESSGSGIRLIDWLDDMINRRFRFGSDWRNATCFPDCVP